MEREQRVAREALAVVYDDVVEAGGAVCQRAPAASGSAMLNRAVGLGVDRPATTDDVDAVITAYEGFEAFYVAVAPAARPAVLPEMLAARGLRPGWGWMAFRRGVDDPPPARSALELVEVAGSEESLAFARIVCAGYGLPEAAVPWTATAWERGWTCWLALDGDEPAAAAGLYVADGVGYLGFAATLPAHRRKGAQGALLAARIRRAAAEGCDVVVTETGERRDDLPSNSYRNILRAGFTGVGVTANWLGGRGS